MARVAKLEKRQGMKKLVYITIALLMMVGTVQAERSVRGTVNKVDPENGYIVINRIQYQMIRGKTKVSSGEYMIDIGLLQQGMKVKFIPENTLVTEIRLITPVEFKD